MITIKQRQKKIPFPVAEYQAKAEKIIAALGYADFDLGILLTTNQTIQKFNRDFRDKNMPTDVLSFPYHTDLKAGQRIKVLEAEDKNLGDLIISVEYVDKNPKNMDGDFIQRMDRMLVHGICHLLGHDHIDDADYKKMIRLERKLFKLIDPSAKIV